MRVPRYDSSKSCRFLSAGKSRRKINELRLYYVTKNNSNNDLSLVFHFKIVLEAFSLTSCYTELKRLEIFKNLKLCLQKSKTTKRKFHNKLRNKDLKIREYNLSNLVRMRLTLISFPGKFPVPPPLDTSPGGGEGRA